jgi:UDP-N-acetylglucosamine transferase subunit ALG13
MGTTLEVLAKGRKLISVENTTCVDAHQTEILSILAQEGYLIWCRDMGELRSLLEQVPALRLKAYVPPPCTIAKEIKAFLS